MNRVSSIIYYNDEVFDTEKYKDKSIKRTSKIKELRDGGSAYTPKCPEVELQMSLLDDESDLIKLGDTVETYFNRISTKTRDIRTYDCDK